MVRRDLGCKQNLRLSVQLTVLPIIFILVLFISRFFLPDNFLVSHHVALPSLVTSILGILLLVVDLLRNSRGEERWISLFSQSQLQSQSQVRRKVLLQTWILLLDLAFPFFSLLAWQLFIFYFQKNLASTQRWILCSLFSRYSSDWGAGSVHCYRWISTRTFLSPLPSAYTQVTIYPYSGNHLLMLR